MAKTINGLNMNGLVLAHLQKHGNISNAEAQTMFKCRALPRRIADLKEQGHIIVSTLKKDSTGQRYARYTYVGQQQ